jgi:hypothetical protein
MALTTITGSPACARPGRPVCHVTLTFVSQVPISSFKVESAKHLFLYTGLTLSDTGQPKPPAVVTLNTGAVLSKVRKITAREFSYTAHFTFRVGNDGFDYLIGACTQDVEIRDGLGLPGHHGCGNKSVSAKVAYLG